MKDPTFWILARASGLTAYVLITLSMLAGLVIKSRPFGRAVKAASVVDVHRFLTVLALGAVAIHAAALVLDSTVHIGPAALLVPGLATYRPLWTGLGVVAADLAVLIWISFPLRKRIGTRVWRKLHWATYAVFALATAHGLMAGTDSAQALGLRSLPRGGRDRRVRDGVARSRPPHPLAGSPPRLPGAELVNGLRLNAMKPACHDRGGARRGSGRRAAERAPAEQRVVEQ